MINNKSELESEPPLSPSPVVLLLIDGWGVAPASEINALSTAKTPFFSSLLQEYPVALLKIQDCSQNARYLSIGAGQEILDEEQKVAVNLTALLAQAGKKQIKIVETERLAALNYFFNGGSEEKYKQEECQIISSDSEQAGSAPLSVLKKTVKEVIKAVGDKEHFDFIVSAIPFLELVALKGKLDEVQQAVETLDRNLRLITEAVLAKGGVLVLAVTGGKAERILNTEKDVISNDLIIDPVPIVVIGSEFKGKTIGLADPLNNDLNLLTPAGTLADISPTILDIMGINQPTEMTGKSLLDKN